MTVFPVSPGPSPALARVAPSAPVPSCGAARHYVIVSEWLEPTHGQGRVNLEIAKALAAAGHDTTAVCAAARGSPSDPSIPLRIEKVGPSFRLPTNWMRGEIFRLRARRTVEKLRRNHAAAADARLVVISNGAAIAEPGDINIANFVHSAWIDSPWHPARHAPGLHSSYLMAYGRHQAREERRAFSAAPQVVAVSNVVRDELNSLGLRDASDIVVIPPGVDTTEFRPRHDREPNELRLACGLEKADSDPFLVMFAGEIRSGRKNLELLLRAIAAIPRVHLCVAGSTKGSDCPALAASLGVGARVHWLGQRADMPCLLRGADMFVLPSHYEPYGLVVAEAMASGVPVIVTRQCGSAWLVGDDAGILLDDGAALDQLIEATRLLSSDPDVRQRIAARARQMAISYTWRDMTDRYLELLDRQT